MDAELYAYDALAKEIIIQAIKDYVRALKNIKKGRKMYEAKRRIKELKMFFTSEWFCLLSDMDGKKLIKKIEKDYENIHFEGRKKQKN